MPNPISNAALLAIMSEQKKAALKAVLEEYFSDALFCTRSWEAWWVGTMSEEDFVHVNDEGQFDECVNALLAALIEK